MRGLARASYCTVIQGLRGLQSAFQCRFSSSQESSGSKEKIVEDNGFEIRKIILDAALPFVSQHGWSKQALIAGAEAVGHPGVAHGLFCRGEIELVQHFYESCNQQFAQDLKQAVEESSTDPSKQKEPLSFIKDAFKARLLMIAPYHKEWPQALGIMALPPNIPTAVNCLFTLVDDVSYYAGDRSVNFNWYVHRMTLAGIYQTTEIYFMQDKSKNYQATWNFLARRVNDAATLRDSLQYSSDASRLFGEVTVAAFVTIQNMFGLHLSRR
ncbi:ubiquinone biosynthesis protein COQ9, mitochondrial [Anabrus simplex]|uniref:ubiquinone biosynthesis protein COQ9, mitochondrial n=1 Tax=Anabrus simplex TaxID=316456 RepID=UPI0035A37D5A